jgi:O-antigen/teichoic acid export membrane protein
MRGIAYQAAVLSISRIANFGLMIVSPLILVRFLSVADFGRYREFLLYASVLQSIATFSVPDSLLYFIPLHPRSPWRVVDETASLTGIISLSVVGLFVGVDLLVPHGGLVGPYLIPVCVYVLLFVNLDWWETFWVARRQTIAVFAYTAGRLIARMTVVVCVAVITRDVMETIWSLVALEAIRLLGSFVAWRRMDESASEPALGDIRRQQLIFCVPLGFATITYMLSRNLGNLVIAKYLGAAALAVFTIGTYGEPIILALRNSISQVVLTEMVRRSGSSRAEAIVLWSRTTVVNCLLLFPAAALVAWYAEPLVVKAFGAAYRPAVPVLQWYSLVIVRSCFDFAPLLRSINKTRPFITAGIVTAIVNGVALWLLIPRIGVVGAAIGLVIAYWFECIYLAVSVNKLYGVGWRALVPWWAVLKVAVCAVLSAAIAFGITYNLRESLLGVLIGAAIYGVAFVVLLRFSGLDEARSVLTWVRGLIPVPARGS